LAAEIGMDIAEAFAQLEGIAFVSGNGVRKPMGFLSETITTKNSGTASTIKDANGQADGLIDALYDLPEFYRNRATWLMNGATLASLRKVKTGQGDYIWQPALAAGQPETILGRPVIEMPDMPSEGAGTYPVAIGDWQSAYRIMDRIDLQITRDPFTQQSSGMVRFWARKRVGGGLVKAEAVRLVKCST
jgi:HK97 family phage major capsid protein